MVDETLILRKLGELDQHLGQLAEFSNITLDAYCADWKTQRVVERTLQIMLELCVDIANHIIADESLRPPKNYADTFVSLEERGVLSSELCSTMQKMARFRNIIVPWLRQAGRDDNHRDPQTEPTGFRRLPRRYHWLPEILDQTNGVQSIRLSH